MSRNFNKIYSLKKSFYRNSILIVYIHRAVNNKKPISYQNAILMNPLLNEYGAISMMFSSKNGSELLEDFNGEFFHCFCFIAQKKFLYWNLFHHFTMHRIGNIREREQQYAYWIQIVASKRRKLNTRNWMHSSNIRKMMKNHKNFFRSAKNKFQFAVSFFDDFHFFCRPFGFKIHVNVISLNCTAESLQKIMFSLDTFRGNFCYAVMDNWSQDWNY